MLIKYKYKSGWNTNTNTNHTNTTTQPNCAWQVVWKGGKQRRRASRKLADHLVLELVEPADGNTEHKYYKRLNAGHKNSSRFIKGWMLGTHIKRRDQAFQHWKCNGNGEDGCFEALHVQHQYLIRLHCVNTLYFTVQLQVSVTKHCQYLTTLDYTTYFTEQRCKVMYVQGTSNLH